MTAAALITLRETLEASLIVGIILAYLQRSGEQRHNPVVWLGVLAGAAASLLVAFVFQTFASDLHDGSQEIFEGVTMLVAAGLLAWMILWMLGQRRLLRRNIERKVALHLERGSLVGLFTLAAVGVAREGVETVIFLQAVLFHSDAGMQLLGSFLGIGTALLVSWLFFRRIVLLSLREFFSVTSVLLILFAAGLVAHGVHELQEGGVLPLLTATAWDINPAVAADGSFPLLHEKGIVGSILKGLFGYNGDPTVLEVLACGMSLIGLTALWGRMESR